MPLNIIIFTEKILDPQKIKKALSAQENTLLKISESVFIYQTKETPSQLLKKLAGLSNQPITIFDSPSTGWATTLKDGNTKNWIQEVLNEDIQPRSVVF